jgi:60 kDa SS-A/Ro ribonucleoprotein
MAYVHLLRNIYPGMRDNTFQSLALNGMIPNNAGGHYYEVDDWVKLDRFLILGTDAGTYYVNAQDLTKANLDALNRCCSMDGGRVVRRIVEISQNGRAPKNDAAILALAVCCGAKDLETRRQALASINSVCRTGTHLLMFVEFVKRFRGMGRGLRNALGRWFTEKTADQLALQAVKYNQRNGWALRDVLRLAHPSDAKQKDVIFDFIVSKEPHCEMCKDSHKDCSDLLKSLYDLRDEFKQDPFSGKIAPLIKKYKLPREAIPTELLNHKEIWAALLEDMPMTAMIRNLGKMTNVGILDHFGDATKMVCERLGDAEKLSRARIHPFQILLASKTYQQGHGDKGSLKWEPNAQIVSALNKAFDLTFPQVRSTGARVLVSVDCSGSMGSMCSGNSSLSAWQAGAAMALIMSKSERNAIFTQFDTQIYGLDIIDKRLDDVLNMRPHGGGTDVSLPIRYALDQKINLDAIVIFTDNETFAGDRHAVQALHQYRNQINPKVKLIVAALAANSGSVIDPNDPLSFGICGLDASVPQLITDFIKGE